MRPIYQREPLLILAYTVLFVPLAVGSVRAAVESAPIRLEEVARSLGRSPVRAFTAVTARVALPGIGPWTAQYIALRALGHPDAFPAEDLVLQKMLPNDGTRITAKALRTHAEAWRPWRGYAVFHLWREAAASTPERTAIPARPRARTLRSPSP